MNSENLHKEIETIKKNQLEINNTATESTADEMKQIIWISDLEHNIAKNTQIK